MKYIKQMAIIITISLVAQVMERLIPLPIAGSVYGLVLMLIGLMTHIIPLEKVEGAADFLIEIMPMMFLPASVGLMSSMEALQDMLIPLAVISVVSTVITFGATGRFTQYLIRRDRQKEEQNHE